MFAIAVQRHHEQRVCFWADGGADRRICFGQHTGYYGHRSRPRPLVVHAILTRWRLLGPEKRGVLQLPDQSSSEVYSKSIPLTCNEVHVM
jgi:hypothetical protein